MIGIIGGLAVASAVSAGTNVMQFINGLKNKKLNEQVNELNRQIKERDEIISKLIEQKTKLKEELSLLVNAINVCNHNNEELKKQLSATKIFAFKMKNELKAKISNLELEISDKNMALDNLKNNIADCDQNILNYTGENEILKGELSKCVS